MKSESFTSYIYVESSKSESGKSTIIPSGINNFAKNKRDLHLFFKTKPGLIPGELSDPGLYAVTAAHMSHQVEVRKVVDTSEGEDGVEDESYKKTKFPGIWKISDSNFFEFTHSGVPTLSFVMDIKKEVLDKDGGKEKFNDFMASVAYKIADKGLNVGLIDGIAWADSLKDFSINVSELPRILVTDDDFKVWYEDKDLLSVEKVMQLADDYHKLLKSK